MAHISIQKSLKILFIPVLIVSLNACNETSDKVVKRVIPQQRAALNLPETSLDVSSQSVELAQREIHKLLSKIQQLETQLLDANAIQPILVSALEEVAALKEQLKASGNQFSNVDKKALSAITMNTQDNDDIWIALIDENFQLHDNLSEFKKDLQTLDLKYQDSQQEVEILKMELAANQQIIHSQHSN